MTHPTYSYQQLQLKSIARLKQIYSEIGCCVEVMDKRCKDSWINAIITHQSTQLEKVDEQSIAQAELNDYIAAQANAMSDDKPLRIYAPEELRTVEISFYDHEYYAGDELIAAISYDHTDFATQPWVVMVGSEEKFRANTWAKCHRYIQWHHQDGTLDEPKEEGVQGAGSRGERFSPMLPVPCSLSSSVCTTGNEIMVQIFDECEKYGLELLDDGIYHNDMKLGEVGCTQGKWWVIRAGGNQERIPCDSAMDAVRKCKAACRQTSLSVEESAECEKLLDLPFELLTSQDWQRLLDYEPHQEPVAA
jgi:hypothetical protein